MADKLNMPPRASRDGGYTIHALAILPDHWHIVLGRHSKPIDQIVAHLKALATKHLRRAGLHPLARFPKKDGSLPTPWSRNHWKVFIDSDEQMDAAIRYVQSNPVREGLAEQCWAVVVPYPA